MASRVYSTRACVYCTHTCNFSRSVLINVISRVHLKTRPTLKIFPFRRCVDAWRISFINIRRGRKYIYLRLRDWVFFRFEKLWIIIERFLNLTIIESDVVGIWLPEFSIFWKVEKLKYRKVFGVIGKNNLLRHLSWFY